MEEIIITIIMTAVQKAVGYAVEHAIDYVVRKVVDAAGKVVTEIVYMVDSDGDGVGDTEQVVYTLDVMIPDFDDGYCLVNAGDDIGVGLPMYELIDGSTIGDYIDVNDPYNLPTVTGNDDGYLVDLDNDGQDDDVLIPLPDFTGDGLPDWGWLVDDDDNGLPDASPAAPFYPIGSDEYNTIVEQQGSINGGIIIMAPDGTMSVYDPSGQLIREDYNQAYDLWLQDNAALVKPFDNFSVSEFLLLIIAAFAAFSLIGKLFKRRHYL